MLWWSRGRSRRNFDLHLHSLHLDSPRFRGLVEGGLQNSDDTNHIRSTSPTKSCVGAGNCGTSTFKDFQVSDELFASCHLISPAWSPRCSPGRSGSHGGSLCPICFSAWSAPGAAWSGAHSPHWPRRLSRWRHGSRPRRPPTRSRSLWSGPADEGMNEEMSEGTIKEINANVRVNADEDADSVDLSPPIKTERSTSSNAFSPPSTSTG